MGDPLPFDPAPPPRRHATPLVWALTALAITVALLIGGWQFLERRRAEDRLASSQGRVARLEEDVRRLRDDLRALGERAEELRGAAVRERETAEACLEAFGRLSRAWDSVIGALNAAESLQPSEAERFREEANEHRREALAAAAECG